MYKTRAVTGKKEVSDDTAGDKNDVDGKEYKDLVPGVPCVALFVKRHKRLFYIWQQDDTSYCYSI